MNSAKRPPQLGMMLLIGVGLGVAGTQMLFGASSSQPAVSAEPQPVLLRGPLATFEQTTVDLFEQRSPSVVNINTRRTATNRFMRRGYEVPAGSGSGFVWDEAGHIVTNYHVIQEASSAQVVFDDQSSYAAELVGVSPAHDLAVLRVNRPQDGLSPVPIGTSSDLRVGQAVYAIGNPFGLSQTLTTGVLSARSRQIQGPSGRTIEDVIQIDAAINPGNSGGPLFDTAGSLIGVNTAIYSPSGASAGVGFAIPVDTVNRVVPQLITNGRYAPPQLGIRSSAEASNFVNVRMGVSGVTVLDVEPGSGAERAGMIASVVEKDGSLKLGDVIQRIAGRDVTTFDSLLAELERHQPGETVDVVVYRGSEQTTLKVTLQ